jgi:hypothetical protein
MQPGVKRAEVTLPLQHGELAHRFRSGIEIKV